MINPKIFFDELNTLGVDFYAGVPDSLLKYFCAYVTDNVSSESHVIAANEGAAVGLGIGYHLSTGGVPLVYLQNSGLGNTINPIASLADEDVYSVPMLLMIGWRGEPGVKDEPQHIKQGRITLETLEVMGIPYVVIDENEAESIGKLKEITSISKQASKPCAIVVKKGAFSKYSLKGNTPNNASYKREDVIQAIAEKISEKELVVSTTGMASRELFEYRACNNQGHAADFLTVGGMGHASQIALGVAKGAKDRNVICIDGDGAALMHMGSLAISGMSGVKNFKHIVINNGAHDSVGGQPTLAFDVDLTAVAKACGYQCFSQCKSLEQLNDVIQDFLQADGPVFLEVFSDKGSRPDLGRPTTTPKENKQAYMGNIGLVFNGL